MRKITLFIFLLCILCSCEREHTQINPESSGTMAKPEELSEMTLKENPRKFTPGERVYIRIFKEERQLELWRKKTDGQYELHKTFAIANFSGSLGPKKKEGDYQAPEGFYYFTKQALNPNSSYHLSFNIGYPNKYDRQLRRTGSWIMVHGGTASVGCFAMTDARIEKIYRICEKRFADGQKFIRIHIFPFRMTEANMQRHAKNKHIAFWSNLQRGYSFFQKSGREPDVRVENGKYTFH